MAILEAMAHGLCVIATDVGGISDVGVSGHEIFQPGERSKAQQPPKGDREQHGNHGRPDRP